MALEDEVRAYQDQEAERHATRNTRTIQLLKDADAPAQLEELVKMWGCGKVVELPHGFRYIHQFPGAVYAGSRAVGLYYQTSQAVVVDAAPFLHSPVNSDPEYDCLRVFDNYIPDLAQPDFLALYCHNDLHRRDLDSQHRQDCFRPDGLTTPQLHDAFRSRLIRTLDKFPQWRHPLIQEQAAEAEMHAYNRNGALFDSREKAFAAAAEQATIAASTSRRPKLFGFSLPGSH